MLLTAAVSPGFRSSTNLQNVLTNVAPLAIVVLGQSMVILVRGFDLSVSSVMATAAVIATQFEGAGLWPFLSRFWRLCSCRLSWGWPTVSL